MVIDQKTIPVIYANKNALLAGTFFTAKNNGTNATKARNSQLNIG
jgi:hypothetical protein